MSEQRGPDRQDDVVRDHIRLWSEELVDLTRRNRLLYFKHTRSASLEFEQDARVVMGGLDHPDGWGFFLPAPTPDDPNEVYDPGIPAADALVVAPELKRSGADIERGLKNLAAKAQAEFLDAGLWVLYLGLGALEWRDPADQKLVRSPLLLVPVHLERMGPEKRWRLTWSDDGEAALNPALSVKLENELGIRLPTLDGLGDPTYASVAEAVRSAVTAASWIVRDAAVLTTFTFQKEVIYRDLRDNQEAIAAHPLVRLLAVGPSSAEAAVLDFAPEPDEGLDHRHPPEDLVTVLDADSTQRKCVIAARAGHSYVMDGPPGTGKSQTITNMIAQLLTDGKTVLFVSEKAAALEVVERRLAELQLDPFVLGLHSHTATRQAVAQELGRALGERPVASAKLTSSDRAAVAADRERLTAYASAVNEVRRPLQRSLHDVVGRISGLPDEPPLPVPGVDVRNLTAADLADLRSWADRLGRAWGPIERGEDFMWRDLSEDVLAGGHETDLRQRVESCERSYAALEERSRLLHHELRLPEEPTPDRVTWLRQLLSVIDRRQPVAAGWLAMPDVEQLSSRVRDLAVQLRERSELETSLGVLTSSWAAVDPLLADRVAAATADLARLDPPLVVDNGWTAAEMVRLIAGLEEVAQSIPRIEEPASRLGRAFGFDDPVPTPLLERLTQLGSLAGDPTPPEAHWLNPVLRPALDEARQVLTQQLVEYRQRRQAVTEHFTDAVLELDLPALAARFREVHTGLRKLGGAYRADKRTLASVAVTGTFDKGLVEHLDAAVQWQRSASSLTQAEERHGALLGERYYRDRQAADVDRIERAFHLADRALALAAGQIKPEDLARQLSAGVNPDPDLLRVAAETAATLASLWPESLVGVVSDRVTSGTLREVFQWCTAASMHLRGLWAIVGEVDDQTGRRWTIGDLADLGPARKRHALLTQDIDQLVASLADAVGESLDTSDPTALESATEWVAEVRALFDGAVRARTAALLLTAEVGERSIDAFGQSQFLGHGQLPSPTVPSETRPSRYRTNTYRCETQPFRY